MVEASPRDAVYLGIRIRWQTQQKGGVMLPVGPVVTPHGQFPLYRLDKLRAMSSP